MIAPTLVPAMPRAAMPSSPRPPRPPTRAMPPAAPPHNPIPIARTRIAPAPTLTQRGQPRAYTGARDHASRNALFFEDLENPNVCDAAGKATAQGDTNRGYALGFGPHTRCAG